MPMRIPCSFELAATIFCAAVVESVWHSAPGVVCILRSVAQFRSTVFRSTSYPHQFREPQMDAPDDLYRCSLSRD